MSIGIAACGPPLEDDEDDAYADGFADDAMSVPTPSAAVAGCCGGYSHRRPRRRQLEHTGRPSLHLTRRRLQVKQPRRDLAWVRRLRGALYRDGGAAVVTGAAAEDGVDELSPAVGEELVGDTAEAEAAGEGGGTGLRAADAERDASVSAAAAAAVAAAWPSSSSCCGRCCCSSSGLIIPERASTAPKRAIRVSVRLMTTEWR